ncbi:MAG: TonB-dependent receptor, partial [Flavobacteriaceae bacterium]|nr:TonB-dependent receptor [Flavobacteriaceae bacterium]
MKKGLVFICLLGTVLLSAQETDILKDTVNLDEVLVVATRVTEKAPFTQSNLSKDDIEERNLGQDIPILLNFLPNAVTTSDAGAGVGYT